MIDCETSGLSSQKNKVLTVGLLHAEITKSRLRIFDEEHIKIRHAQYNPSGLALKINKINLDEHHKVAIQPSKACQRINEFLNKNALFNAPVLGHNVLFDYRFLEALHKQGNADFLINTEYVDTMMMWRDLKKKNVVPNSSKSSLKHVSKFFGVSYNGAHDALVDCKITAEVYRNLLRL